MSANWSTGDLGTVIPSTAGCVLLIPEASWKGESLHCLARNSILSTCRDGTVGRGLHTEDLQSLVNLISSFAWHGGGNRYWSIDQSNSAPLFSIALVNLIITSPELFCQSWSPLSVTFPTKSLLFLIIIKWPCDRNGGLKSLKRMYSPISLVCIAKMCLREVVNSWLPDIVPHRRQSPITRWSLVWECREPHRNIDQRTTKRSSKTHGKRF